MWYSLEAGGNPIGMVKVGVYYTKSCMWYSLSLPATSLENEEKMEEYNIKYYFA